MGSASPEVKDGESEEMDSLDSRRRQGLVVLEFIEFRGYVHDRQLIRNLVLETLQEPSSQSHQIPLTRGAERLEFNGIVRDGGSTLRQSRRREPSDRTVSPSPYGIH